MKKYIFLAGVFFLFLIHAKATELHVDKSKNNLVTFISDAPFEDIEGVTNNIDGYIFWAGNDTLNSSDFYFEVGLNNLDTGIGLRNRHMRDNYLETGKYPTAKYRGKLSEIKKNGENEYEIKTTGKFFIHGSEKEVSIIGKITVTENLYHVQCKFEIKLTDFKIKVPKLMFMKISEIIDLRLDFYLKKVTA